MIVTVTAYDGTEFKGGSINYLIGKCTEYEHKLRRESEEKKKKEIEELKEKEIAEKLEKEKKTYYDEIVKRLSELGTLVKVYEHMSGQHLYCTMNQNGKMYLKESCKTLDTLYESCICDYMELIKNIKIGTLIE